MNSSNKSAAKHCECDATTFANNLAQFSGPDLPLKLMQVGDLPQTFRIASTAIMNDSCGLKEWSELCEALEFKVTISVLNKEITELPYKCVV